MADVIDFSNKTLRTPIEQTNAYQFAYRLAQEIHKATLEIPAVEQKELADDVRRLVRAICSHMVEGFEKQKDSSPSFYVEADILTAIAIGDTRKIAFLLGYCRDLGYIDAARCEAWCAGYAEILQMLQAMNDAAKGEV